MFSMFNKKKEAFVFPEHVLSQDDFFELICNDKKRLHDFMVNNNKYITVFICEKETEEDRQDPSYLENCEVDLIINDYKNIYYIAQLKTIKNGYHPAIANALCFGYHELWSYSFDRLKPYYKKMCIKNYHICDINKRPDFFIHMSNDFMPIYNVIKSLHRDIIENKICEILDDKRKLKAIDGLMKLYEKELKKLNYKHLDY